MVRKEIWKPLVQSPDDIVRSEKNNLCHCTSILKVAVPVLIQIILVCIKIRLTIRVSTELNAYIKQCSIPHDRR
jgi:hypothetical protein